LNCAICRCHQAHNLAIEQNRLAIDRGGDELRQASEARERVPVARHESAVSILDLGHCAEAVMLQFKQPVWIAERLA
jgi:hypothetical protein